MFFLYRSISKLGFIISCLLCLHACDSIDLDKENPAANLQDSFEKIYYARFAKDFPSSEEALSRCKEYKDESCLKVYQLFKEGKETILSLSANHVLPLTLDIIEQACLSDDENMANSVCYGALMSLFFYGPPQQDEVIFSKIKAYPRALKNIIFNHDFLWYHNRPNRDIWIDYIISLDIDWEDEYQKEFIISLFKKEIAQVEGDFWVR